MKRSPFVTLALLALTGSAVAGPAYQTLKACLADCIDTTERATWARFTCVADCYADYADSKLSLSASIDESSTGWHESSNGAFLLTPLDGSLMTVACTVDSTSVPGSIERVVFRLYNDANPDGEFLAEDIAPGMTMFSAEVSPVALGADGMIVAEVHQVGGGDVDDVIAIYYATRAMYECNADMSGSADPADPMYGFADGLIDASDFFFFLDKFIASDYRYADLTTSHDRQDPFYGVPNGQIDSADFFYYLDLYVTLCR